MQFEGRRTLLSVRPSGFFACALCLAWIAILGRAGWPYLTGEIQRSAEVIYEARVAAGDVTAASRQRLSVAVVREAINPQARRFAVWAIVGLLFSAASLAASGRLAWACLLASCVAYFTGMFWLDIAIASVGIIEGFRNKWMAAQSASTVAQFALFDVPIVGLFAACAFVSISSIIRPGSEDGGR